MTLDGEYHGKFGQDPGTTARVLLALVEHQQGYLDTGVSLARDADQQAKSLKHPLTMAYVTKYGCFMQADRFEVTQLEETGASFDSICREYNINQWEMLGPFYQTWARLLSGGGDAFWHSLEALLEQHRARGFRLHMPHHLRFLATAFIRAEQLERAKRCLDEASDTVAEFGERWVEPELARCRASLLLHQVADQRLMVEDCLRESCQVAAAQGARLSELRAARDLARLWADHGEKRKAHDLLAPIYGWFTEGFDTADLTDAKALLDELR